MLRTCQASPISPTRRGAGQSSFTAASGTLTRIAGWHAKRAEERSKVETAEAALAWSAGRPARNSIAGTCDEQGRPNPDVVSPFAQHVPNDYSELPRRRDGGNMLAASCCHALVE